jgi:hypothetical protein
MNFEQILKYSRVEVAKTPKWKASPLPRPTHPETSVITAPAQDSEKPQRVRTDGTVAGMPASGGSF